MAVRLRLKRMGRKKQPFYRIVAADQRSPRDGRHIEVLGHYNPMTQPSQVVVDLARVERRRQPVRHGGLAQPPCARWRRRICRSGRVVVRDLVDYIVRPLVQHPEDLQVTEIEGSASVLLELRIHAADEARVRGEDNRRLRAIQQVLAAAGGSRKPILDLIQAGADEDGED